MASTPIKLVFCIVFKFVEYIFPLSLNKKSTKPYCWNWRLFLRFSVLRVFDEVLGSQDHVSLIHQAKYTLKNIVEDRIRIN